MKVGIIISLTKEYESMWINGIKLNALNLSKMLNQINGLENEITGVWKKVQVKRHEKFYLSLYWNS